MTEQRKANIIELFDGAKDQKEQIELMTKMGFGTKREIIDLLHETGRALDITIRRPATKKEEPKEEAQETPKEEKEERQLPIPQDVKQLLMEELEGIESAIQDVEAIIADREKEKKRLETLYKHVVEVLGQ
ncbi:MAG: hypothetical protein IKG39_01745 [Lachnospiraceae bacterium]|nr:hypothetical protein [Lachnospiraceae bacterium]